MLQYYHLVQKLNIFNNNFQKKTNLNINNKYYQENYIYLINFKKIY